MLKRMIHGWNAAPGAPVNWDPTMHGTCGVLPIRVHPPCALLPGQGHLLQYVESAWEPTPDELATLNAGGSLILRIHGWQVPVAVYCEPAKHEEPTP